MTEGRGQMVMAESIEHGAWGRELVAENRGQKAGDRRQRLLNSIFCGSLLSSTAVCQSGQRKYQKTVPFWLSFIREIV